jgi:hypothetical protein
MTKESAFQIVAFWLFMPQGHKFNDRTAWLHSQAMRDNLAWDISLINLRQYRQTTNPKDRDRVEEMFMRGPRPEWCKYAPDPLQMVAYEICRDEYHWHLSISEFMRAAQEAT